MLKKYEELSEVLKKDAREMHPNEYKDWKYRLIGVYIEFSAK